MKHARRTKRILAGMLALSILATSQMLSPIWAAEESVQSTQQQLEEQKKTLDQQLDELSKKRQELDQKLLTVREDKNRQLEYRNTLQEQIKVVQEQIAALSRQVEQLDAEIEEKSNQIEGKLQEIDEKYELLKKRIRAIYMAGESNALDIILNSKDVNDFLDKAMILQRVSLHDTQLIEELSTAVAEVQGEKDAIEAAREQVAKNKKQLDSSYKELTALQEECDQLIEQLDGQEGELTQQQQDAAREKEQFDEELAQWHREYVANQKKQQESSSSAPSSQKPPENSSSSKPDDSSSHPSSSGSSSSSSSSSSSGSSSSSPKPDPDPEPDPQPPVSQTKYLWPLPGFTHITDYFGDRPIYGYHRGIDISGPNVFRQTIVAAEDGVVIRANSTDSWGSGWGYHVMIDHGDGYATQYAHCDEILVSVGQSVKRGQPIALVGNTGDSYGAHLHFEVWQNGTRIDPLPFIQ